MPSFTVMVDKMEMRTPDGQAVNMNIPPDKNEIHIHVPEQAPPRVEVTNNVPVPKVEVTVQPAEVKPADVTVHPPNISVSPIIQVQVPKEVQMTRKISIEGIKRDPSGRMTSAEAEVTAN
jgi:hypothetical protein